VDLAPDQGANGPTIPLKTRAKGVSLEIIQQFLLTNFSVSDLPTNSFAALKYLLTNLISKEFVTQIHLLHSD